MGVGEITREALRENDIMEEEQVSELFERCPGDCWSQTLRAFRLRK
jgi:hypothetical protein